MKKGLEERRFTGSLARSIIISIVILILVTQIISGIIGYIEFTVVLSEQYKKSSSMVAHTTYRMIDNGDILQYLNTKTEDTSYLETERRLQKLADAAECRVIYVAAVDENYAHRTYIFDVCSAESGYKPYEIGHVDDIREENAEDFRKVFQGEIVTYSHDDYSTALFPMKDSRNDEIIAVIGVVKPMTELTMARITYFRQIAIFTGILTFVVTISWIYFIRRRLINPLKKIAKETQRFSENEELPAEKLHLSVNLNNELGRLAYEVDKMEEKIVNDVQEIMRITSEKNRVMAELDLARKIQDNVLPKISAGFPGRKEFTINASMKPAKEIGGDLYDFFFIDDDHFAIVMADVSGKGIPAALFMMISKILIKNRCMKGGEPNEILEDINNVICVNNREDMFVTVWIGILEISSGIVTAANAGHEYPILCQAGGNFELFKDPHGFVIGGMENMKYKTYRFRMEKDSVLFIYTDGVTEAVNSKNEQYGMGRLLKALDEAEDRNPDSLIEGVTNDIESFVENANQFDDTTMLSVHYFGPEENVVSAEDTKGNVMAEFKIEALKENLNHVMSFVDEHLEGVDCPMKAQMQIDLCVEEMFINVASYAYGSGKGDVIIRLEEEKDPSGISIVLVDEGMPYDPLAKADPDVTASADQRQIGGLGIFLVKKNMDNISYRRDGNKNVFRMTKFF